MPERTFLILVLSSSTSAVELLFYKAVLIQRYNHISRRFMEENIFMLLFSFCLGIGLAASVGFRVFLPLLVLSIATHYGYELNEQWSWLGSWTAITVLGVAAIAEICAYYIPIIDNALDTISVPLAGIAGTFLMAISLTGIDSELILWALAIIAGGGTAAAIKGSVASGRIASSVSTLGMGNFIISSLENILSFLLSVLSFFFPLIAFLAVAFIFIGIFKGWNFLTGHSQKSSSRST